MNVKQSSTGSKQTLFTRLPLCLFTIYSESMMRKQALHPARTAKWTHSIILAALLKLEPSTAKKRKVGEGEMLKNFPRL